MCRSQRILGGVLVCLLLGVSWARSQQAGQAGTITALKPRDFITRGQQTQEASKGDPVLWRDIIETERGGRLRIGLEDGSILNIGSQARVQIVSHDATTQQSEILLSFGKMRALVQKLGRPDSKFEVRTDVAVAGVVGTNEFIDASNPVYTCATSLEGIIIVQSSDPTIPGQETLYPGEITCVPQGQPPEPKRQATSDQIQDALDSTSLTPEVSLTPATAIQGSAIEAEITGENLLPIESLAVSGEGVSVEVLEGATPTRVPVRISVAADAPLGVRALTLRTPRGEDSVDFAVTPRPSFALQVAPPTSPENPLDLAPGGASRSVQVILLPLGGFADQAELSLGGLPAGVTAELSASTVKAGQPVELSFAAGAGAAPGTYPVTVEATAAGLAAAATVYLRVQGGPPVPQIQTVVEHFFNPVEPPEILSGTSFQVLQGALLRLDASGSSVAGGRIAGFDWQVPDARLRSSEPRIELDTWLLAPGNHRIRLEVTSDLGTSARQEYTLIVSPLPNPDEVLFGLRQAYETLQINQYLSYFDPVRFRAYPGLEESIRNSFQALSEARVYLRIDNRQLVRDDAYYQATFEVDFRTRDNPEQARRRLESQTLRLLLIRSANPGAVWKIVDFAVTVSEVPGDTVASGGTGGGTTAGVASLVLATTPATSQDNPLLINAGSQQTLSLSVTSDTVTGQVNLSAAHPPGLEVSFSSLQVAVNSLVNVTVTASPTAAVGPAEIVLTGQNPSASASLTLFVEVVARPQIAVSPTSLDFGNVLVGTSSPPQIVTIQSTGAVPLTVSSISLGGGGFQLSLPSLPATVPPGGTLTFSVVFSPPTVGAFTDLIGIQSNAGSAQVALAGTGVVPAASVSPTSIDFGDVLVGTTSPPQTVTLTNTGTTNITIADISGGLPPFSFSVTQVPGQTIAVLAPGQSFSFDVTFSPFETGPVTGEVRFGIDELSQAGLPGPTVPLSGNGFSAGVPAISVSPTSLDFGSVAVGTTAGPLIVTVTNTGTADLVITNATLSGSSAFSLPSSPTITPPVTVAPGGFVEIDIRFSPTVVGPATGTLTVVSNAGSATVALSGTGVAGAPTISVTPPSLNFPNVPVGTTSTQAVTVQNTGSAALTVNSITVSGNSPFTLALPPLPATLAPGATLSFSVDYAPTAAAMNSDSVAVSSSVGTVLVPVTGNGVNVVGPAISVSPTSLDFGSVEVGLASPVQTVTITNIGNATLTLTNIFLSCGGCGFTKDTTSTSFSLAPGATTTFGVTFTPFTTGPHSDSLGIDSDAPTSPTVIPLAGNGVVSVPGINVSPTSLDFGSVSVGLTSAPQTVTITNTGSVTLTLTSIFLSCGGCGFTKDLTNTSFSLAPGASTTLGVTFSPFTAGPHSDTLGIDSNAPTSPTTIPLSGNGVVSGAAISVSPTSLDFGSILVGTASSPMTITVSNVGTADLVVSTVSWGPTGTFNLFSSPSLPASIAPGNSAIFSFDFVPPSTGLHSGTAQFFSNDPVNSPVNVPLSGTGVTAGAPAIQVSPTSLNFPNVPEGASSTQNLTISNVGTADLTITNIDEANLCDSLFCENDSAALPYPKILTPGSSIVVPVTYSPLSAPFSDSSSIQISSNDPSTPLLSVPLTGNSVVAFTVTPVFHDFTLVTVGTPTPPTLTVTITNTTTSTTLSSVSSVPGSLPSVFQTSATGTSTLSPGASTTFTVTFVPSGVGIFPDFIQVSTNLVSKSLIVRGEGGLLAAGFTVTPSPVDFGTFTLGTSSSPATFTITNFTTSPLTVTSVTSTNFQFTVGTPVPTTVPASGTATFTVTYTASTEGRTEAGIRTETPLGVEYCEVIGTAIAPPAISVAGDSEQPPPEAPGEPTATDPVELVVRAEEVRQEPRRIRLGEPVRFRVPVHNRGSSGVENVLVEFAIPELQLRQRETVDLAAGETLTVVFEVEFSLQDFRRRLRPQITVAPDQEIQEARRADNRAILLPLELDPRDEPLAGPAGARPQRAQLVVAPGQCVGFLFRGTETDCGREADIELSVAADGFTPLLRAAALEALPAISFEQIQSLPEDLRGRELALEPGRMLVVQARSGGVVLVRIRAIRRTSAIAEPGGGALPEARGPRGRRFPGEPAELPTGDTASGPLPLIQVDFEWTGGR